MNLKKESEVVMLPTNEKINSIVKFGQSLRLTPKGLSEMVIYRVHLYFLSDEKVKEGDWCYDKHNEEIIQAPNGGFKGILIKKIIATTDKSLGIKKDGFENAIWLLPQPSPQFIEKYIEEWNKGNKLTKVMVDYEEYVVGNYGMSIDNEPDIDIRLKVDKNNYITITKVKDSWNREEVVTLCLKIQHEYPKFCRESYYPPNTKEIAEWTDNWLEQNL